MLRDRAVHDSPLADGAADPRDFPVECDHRHRYKVYKFIVDTFLKGENHHGAYTRIFNRYR